MRELRDEFGYSIKSHKDRHGLKPGQYMLETDKRLPALPRAISKETRAWVLERNGYTCQMCGAAAGDADPYHPGLKIRLTMGHIIDKSKGGEDTPENLRAGSSGGLADSGATLAQYGEYSIEGQQHHRARFPFDPETCGDLRMEKTPQSAREAGFRLSIPAASYLS